MPLAAYALPFGIRDIKLRALDNTDTPGTSVDLPAARTLGFAESEDFTELRGDDSLVAIHGSGPTISWSLESGGISVDAWKLISGGSVTSTGTTPNVKKVLSKLGSDSRPYFQCEGQSISDNGGDMHALLYKCKANADIGGEFSEGGFITPGIDGLGLATTQASNIGKLWDLIHNETAVAVT